MGSWFGDLGAEPLAAEGQWKSGSESPEARVKASRHGDLRGEPPALENFVFFPKIT